MASTGLFNHVGTVHRVMTKANEEIKGNTRKKVEGLVASSLQSEVEKPLKRL